MLTLFRELELHHSTYIYLLHSSKFLSLLVISTTTKSLERTESKIEVYVFQVEILRIKQRYA